MTIFGLFPNDLPMRSVFSKISKSRKSRFWEVHKSAVLSPILLKNFLGVDLALISSLVASELKIVFLRHFSGALKIAILAFKGSYLTKLVNF